MPKPPARRTPPRNEGPSDQRPLSVDPAAPIAAVHLDAPAAHPHLYRKRLARIDREAKSGDLVAVYHVQGELLGYGLYNAKSEIAVRMLSHGPELPGEEFWRERLSRAVSLRRELLRLDESTDACRLVFSESDGLSGLVVDQFADTLSAEVFSLGIWQRSRAILQLLCDLTGAKHYLVEPGANLLAHEGCAGRPFASPDCPRQVTIHEFGTRFRVRFEEGHKTGFFCDQRDNRRQLAQLCRGRGVLDLCCYSGGFAVQAKRLGQAAEVTGVDLDEAPLKLARENANLNQVRVRFVQADAFAYMRDMLHERRRFDVVVLDPPKLIKSRAEFDEGKKKLFDLNRLAIQLVSPGGILLTCSCSGLLSEEEFVRVVLAASRQAGTAQTLAAADGDDAGRTRSRLAEGRNVQILARTGPGPDHPVAANFPQAEYLHAVWLRVE
jgi:23S rRNA (cytosine1962-C5)-methyltransferase